MRGRRPLAWQVMFGRSQDDLDAAGAQDQKTDQDPMRSPQKNNRARGRGNRKSSGGGNNANRVYESSGPEGKVRGTPQQIFEKYLTLARDAQTSGDRVAGENFLQHAEHYQRILIQANVAQAQSQPHQQDRRESGGQEQDPGSSDQPEMPVEMGTPQPEAQSDAQPVPQPNAPAVSGLTTIDGDAGASGGLLVGEEEMTTSQPKGRRPARPRRPQPASSGEGEQPAQETGDGQPAAVSSEN